MSDSPDKQTLTFLLRRLQQAGIEPRTDLGQNFMIDMNLQRVLLEAAHIEPHDVVLEVGTGTGGLTMQMAPLAAAVVSVELDRSLHQLAGEELFHLSNVTLLQTDVLKSKNRIELAVLEAVQRQLEAGPERQWKLVANLPYNIATPLISNLLALDRPPRTMTVTVQKEVADRFVARPDKDYGALAIWIQSQCRAEIVRVLPPSVFWPRPKVSSAFVQITLDETLRQRIPGSGLFSRLRAVDVCPSPQDFAERVAQLPEAVRQGPGRRTSGRPGPGAHAAGRTPGPCGNAPPLRGSPPKVVDVRYRRASCHS